MEALGRNAEIFGVIQIYWGEEFRVILGGIQFNFGIIWDNSVIWGEVRGISGGRGACPREGSTCSLPTFFPPPRCGSPYGPPHIKDYARDWHNSSPTAFGKEEKCAVGGVGGGGAGRGQRPPLRPGDVWQLSGGHCQEMQDMDTVAGLCKTPPCASSS